MTTVQSAPQTPAQASQHVHRGNRRTRGPRRGGPRPQNETNGHPINVATQTQQVAEQHSQSTNNASLALRPASVALRSHPTSVEPSSAEVSAAENGTASGRRGRGSGRNRGSRGGLSVGGIRGRGGAQTNGSRGGNFAGRQFGGQLTVDGDNESISTGQVNGSSPLVSQLQGDAPEFRPGQQHQPRNQRRGKPGQPSSQHQQRATPRARRESLLKSKAPDIATRTHEDIANNLYECPICTSEVGPRSKVWQCKTCWTSFHLTCIKKWSTNEGSAAAQRQTQDGEFPPPRQWRCPGCNLPKDTLPSSYTCWCEKEVDPRSISGLPPHSCGQTCGKHRELPKKCPHPCELLCHAGPCPPCTHVGPVQSCYCGKNATSRRCVETNYDTGWSCNEICGDLMPCGEHTCQRPCHEGLCGACEVETDGRCYCGKVEKRLACCDRGEEKPSMTAEDSAQPAISEHWTGIFRCANLCERSYDCGRHQCEQSCHSQQLEQPHCPRSPDVVTHCPCGKTALKEISDIVREFCTATIPNCDKKCMKKLACGHECQKVCHSGECMLCLLTVTIACRCGRVQSPTVCHQGQEEPPQCPRVCKANLNCGRHECGERCCPGERKAAERQATKRKLRPLGAARVIDEGFEAEHICTRPCGRLLRCGNHACAELCHKGPCGTCREAIFDEVGCHCGRTVLQPPLPCGTTPPPCRYDCGRPTSCGHPKVPHSCHGDEEKCPKCPFLQEKPCMCGKKRLRNQPCWLADVHCGEVCGKKLKCGSHFCQKPCHRPGECEDTGKSCQQSCGKAKKACGHPCEEQCHAPSSCREDRPCQNKMLITCDCQHLKQEVKCNASKASEGNSKKTLQCDDECARLARNQRLALALNIDPEAHKDDHVPYSTDTLNMYRESSKWAQIQEREFRVFATDENEKRLRFKPMKPHHRAFLHALSEDFGFDSESMDPEPHRHVAVFKTPRFVMAPMKTLAECVRIRQAEAAVAVTFEPPRKLQSNNDPYNGFLLTQPRFALTIDELRNDLASVLDTVAALSFDISFLASEEIVIKCRPSSPSTTMSVDSIATTLRNTRPSILATVASKQLAHSVQLCALDFSLNILRREADDAANNGGWSQVAAKGAAPRTAPRQTAVGEKSVYTVLGSRLREAKKKRDEEQKAKEPVVEDWEEEVRKEEEAQDLRTKDTDARQDGAADQVTLDGASPPPGQSFADGDIAMGNKVAVDDRELDPDERRD